MTCLQSLLAIDTLILAIAFLCVWVDKTRTSAKGPVFFLCLLGYHLFALAKLT